MGMDYQIMVTSEMHHDVSANGSSP